MKQKETVPIPQKLLLTVDEAAEYSNIGVHRIRDLLGEPDCDFAIKKGAYLLIYNHISSERNRKEMNKLEKLRLIG